MRDGEGSTSPTARSTGGSVAVVDEPAPTSAPSPDDTPRSLTYNPAFDGLRGIAVAAVLAFHGGYTQARGGYLGVSTFFTLSGFLITSLILVERSATGRVDLRRFWARRARRLLPASALTLLGVCLWALVADADWERNLRSDVLAAVFQVANWRFLFDERSYGDLFATPSPVLHFWSLAIEEQFYWLFPAVAAGVLAATRGSLRALGGLVVGLLALSATLLVVVGPGDMDFAYYATPVRMGEILAGALLAIVLVAHGPLRDGDRLARPAAWLGVVALVATLWAWWSVEQTTPSLYRGGLVLYAGVSTALVLACTVAGPIRRVLAWAPLRLLGVVSYGVYLAHWPVFLWLDEQLTGWSGTPLFALRVGVTLAIATASYVLVERPVRAGWRPARPAMPVLAAATVALVVLVAVLVPATSPAPADPFSRKDEDLRELSASEIPDGALLAVSLGDSTVLNTTIGLNRWGLEREDAVVTVQGLGGMGCSISRGGERRYTGRVGSSPDYCDSWASDIPDAVERAQEIYGGADFAIMGAGPWDLADRRLPDEDVWRSPGDPVYDAFLRSELAAATDAFLEAGLPVVWLTTPYFDVGRRMQPPPAEPFPESDPDRVDLLNGIVRDLVAERPQAAVVDLGGYLDSLPDATDERLRPDGIHLERDAAAEVAADWLGAAIIDAVPSR